MRKLQKIMFIAATVHRNVSSKEDWAGETIERLFFHWIQLQEGTHNSCLKCNWELIK